MYLPDLRSMRVARVFALGDAECVVCTDCVSNQRTQYAHVMFVRRRSEANPSFAVAAEVNLMAEDGRAVLARMAAEGAGPDEIAATARLVGSHFLGVFPGDGHRNYGASDDWADLDKFTTRALELVAEEFSITAPPVERPADEAPPAPKTRGAGPAPNAAPWTGRAKPWWRFWK